MPTNTSTPGSTMLVFCCLFSNIGTTQRSAHSSTWCDNFSNCCGDFCYIFLKYIHCGYSMELLCEVIRASINSIHTSRAKNKKYYLLKHQSCTKLQKAFSIFFINLFIFFQENKAWYFMWMLGRLLTWNDNLIFFENEKKNALECHLLQFWMAL